MLLFDLLHFLPIKILILPLQIFKLLLKVNLLKDLQILLHLQQFLLLLLNFRVDLLVFRLFRRLDCHEMQFKILLMLKWRSSWTLKWAAAFGCSFLVMIGLAGRPKLICFMEMLHSRAFIKELTKIDELNALLLLQLKLIIQIRVWAELLLIHP